MKNSKFLKLFNQFGMPVSLMAFGVLLLVFPDSASVVIAYGMGGILLLAGLVIGIGALLDRRLSKGLWALVCLSIGSTLLGKPLLLARNVGLFLGILLAVEGGRCLRKGSRLFGTVLLIAAAALILSPMTLSRLIFSVCGVALLLAGVISLLQRLKERRYLDDGGKPDIIDAL